MMTISKIDFSKRRKLLAGLGLGLALILFALQKQSRADLDASVTSISVQQAETLIKQGALVVDVRGPEAYGARHIPGALNIPLDMLRTAIPAVLAGSIAKPVVVYCGDGVTIGPEGTALLNKAGYAQAVNVQHGIQGWAAAGMPIAK